MKKEGSLFKGGARKSFYEAMLSSDDRISTISQNHRSELSEKSQACSSLLLYRLVDAIAFAHGHEFTGSMPSRQPFTNLSIPVCLFFRHPSQTNFEQGWKAFSSDWHRVVRNAGATLYQDLPETGGLCQTDVTLKHLESVCQRLGKVERNKTLINFELAAMYLTSLLKGKDYPDTLSELAEMHNMWVQILLMGEICKN